MKLLRTYIRSTLNEIQSMTFYHGTSKDRLPSIAKNGLIPLGGEKHSANWGGADFTKANYITPNFSLAARYATGPEEAKTPIVLEIVISKHRRFKKIKYDPMDRQENAWDMDLAETPLSDFQDNVGNSIEFAQKILSKTMKKYRYFHTFDLGVDADIDLEELEETDGLNIYKIAINYLSSEYPEKARKEIVDVVKEAFPAGPFTEYTEITKSGTVRVTENYYGTREQLQYFDVIPPSAIKWIWIRKKDFPNIPENKIFDTESHETQELPGESSERFENLQNWFRNIDMNFSEDYDFDYLAQQAEDYKQDEIEVAANKASENPSEENIENLKNEIENAEEWIYDEWGQPSFSKEQKWLKLKPMDALWYVSKQQGVQKGFTF